MDRDRGHYDLGYLPKQDPDREYEIEIRIMKRDAGTPSWIMSKWYARVLLTERSWRRTREEPQHLLLKYITLNGEGRGKAERKARNAVFPAIGEASKKARVRFSELE
jgi:hypothetical protein